MTEALKSINSLIWGIPLLVLLMGCGLFFTIRTRAVQVRLFPRALSAFAAQFSRKKTDMSDTGYKALCTALSATVGTGNIAGVAGAIALGGPGAIFWMWIFAFLGMATKFAEAVLSVHFRRRNAEGDSYGGPMYVIEKGMGKPWRFLAVLYSLFGVVAAFGVGNATQVHTVITGIDRVITDLGGHASVWINLLLGAILASLIGVSMRGGAKRIGDIAQLLIPFACIGYILMCLFAIGMRIEYLPAAIASVFRGAFSPKAATSGTIGSIFMAFRIGASRGLFTNEAGMGTAAMAHASANVEHPVQQGLMGIMEVFLDTIVICTLTAFVILTSGTPIPYGTDPAASLSIQAFSTVLGSWISLPLSIFLALFAFATVLGWGLYGMECARYLLGENASKQMWKLQAVTALLSSITGTQTVWLLSETVNGLMAIPNLISLLVLSPVLVWLIKDYRKTPLRTVSEGEKNHSEMLRSCDPSALS